MSLDERRTVCKVSKKGFLELIERILTRLMFKITSKQLVKVNPETEDRFLWTDLSILEQTDQLFVLFKVRSSFCFLRLRTGNHLSDRNRI